MTRLYFDMDGTIANLYGVENWLEKLINEDATPFKEACPIGRMNVLARMLHKAQANGYEIGIITWTPKNARECYNEMVAQAKIDWLQRHLPSVEWNEIKIVAYGIPKQSLAHNGDYLFDDEALNRENWGVNAYEPHEIINVIKGLCAN